MITSIKHCLFVLSVCLTFGYQSALAQQSPASTAKQRVLLEAKLSDDGPVIREGVEWRIFEADIPLGSEPKELAYSFGGSKAFDVPTGEYLVHAAYGHAGIVKKLIVGEQAIREEYILNAGGLRLGATASGNAPLPKRMLRFDVYDAAINEDGDRKLLAKGVVPNQVTALPVGTYHVISYFGSLNAETRADLRVEPGKLTKASLQHRAALVRFRLVSDLGGDAIPDTAWSILTENGEIIHESERTFPSMALAEGNYTAIAKNNDSIYSEDFEVKSGFNQTVEVLVVN